MAVKASGRNRSTKDVTTPRDTFQIINFSSTASQLGSTPVIATPQNIQKGLTYLNSLNGQGGAVAYLSLNDDPVEIMNRFNDRISHPAMTDLSIDWGDMNVTDVYPQIVPDLIVGRPIVVTGRYTGEPSLVKVGGRQGMQPMSFTVEVNEANATKEHKGIASVWARLKIMDLMTQFSRTPDQASELRRTVTQTALEYSLMSTFTAFVAVDSMSKTEGEFGTTVAVPVNVPEGVKYETAVQN